MSGQIGGDVRAVVPILRERLTREDGLQVSDSALSLSAFVRQKVYRAWPESWDQNPKLRFVVIAAKPVDRSGTPGEIDPVWIKLCDQMVADGTHRWLLHTPGLLALERTAP